jgi:hypothetical protein
MTEFEPPTKEPSWKNKIVETIIHPPPLSISTSFHNHPQIYRLETQQGIATSDDYMKKKANA